MSSLSHPSPPSTSNEVADFPRHRFVVSANPQLEQMLAEEVP